MQAGAGRTWAVLFTISHSPLLSIVLYGIVYLKKEAQGHARPASRHSRAQRYAVKHSKMLLRMAGAGGLRRMMAERKMAGRSR